MGKPPDSAELQLQLIHYLTPKTDILQEEIKGKEEMLDTKHTSKEKEEEEQT